MSTKEEEDEEKQGATAALSSQSTTDGLISSCFPTFIGKKKCSSAIDDDGEVYSKANRNSEGKTVYTEKEKERSNQQEGVSQPPGSDNQKGGGKVTVTAEGSQSQQGGSQATVTAQLTAKQDGDRNVVDEDEEEFFYQINQTCPGVAILIGHSQFDTGEAERKGANMDLRTSYEVFQRLGFHIEYFYNEEVMVLQHKLKELARSEKMSKADSLVCVISTHGSEQEVSKGDRDPRLPSNVKVFEHFLSMKNGIMKTKELLEIFDDSHCKALRKKPRIFFIQACRSRTGKALLEQMDPGVQVDIVGPVLRPLPSKTSDFMAGARSGLDSQGQLGSEPQGEQGSQSQIDARGFMPPVIERDGKMCYEHTPPFPLFEDIVEVAPPVCPNNFLVMFATPSEMVAWSENNEGGWLLSALYQEFIHQIRQGSRITLLSTLTDVSRRVAYNYSSNMVGTDYHEMKSVPCLEHKLTRDLYFTPKKMS